MSHLTHEDLLRRFGKVDDPEIEARRQHIIKVLLKMSPDIRQQLVEEGRQEGRLMVARDSLHRVLVIRQLTPNKEDEARIDACTDLATLRRWHAQAITAVSIAFAFA